MVPTHRHLGVIMLDHDVYVSGTDLFGLYLYKVFVNDRYYDKFTSEDWLTMAERRDVANGYKDALDNYHPPVLG